MFENWYKLVGISEEMYEEWRRDLREDLIAWKDGDGVHLRIKLNIFSAFILRRQLKNWNNNNIGCIRLIKLQECEA